MQTTSEEILSTALEGGIGYWAQATSIERDANGHYIRATLAPVHPGDFEPVTVTAHGLKAAAIRACRMYPHSAAAAAIQADDIDADAADMIVQVQALGEVVYG